MSEAVPEGWEIKRLCDLVTLQYGKSPKEISASDGRYPIIGTGGVAGYTDHFLHEGNTTVIGRKGTIDKPSYVGGRFWAIDTTYYGSEYKGADPKWFYYSISEKDLTKHNEASGVPSLGRDTLYAIPVLTPPIPEQQKIATILSSVDDAIEKTRVQIDKLKDLKTGMMQELLTQGIGHTEFKDSPVGRVPEGWAVCDLGEVLKDVVDCEHKTAPYVDRSNYLVVRTTNVSGGELHLSDIKCTTREAFTEWTRRGAPVPGDILFTREAPAGESCMVPEGLNICMGQRMVLLKPDQELADPEFLSLFLSSDSGKQYIYKLSVGTTVTRINIEDIRSIPVPIPTVTEQIKIREVVSSISQLIVEKREKLQAESSFKKALMQDLLTGKVRVNVDQKESEVA